MEKFQIADLLQACTGFEKSAVWSSQTSRFSHQGNNFSVSLDQWVKAQASHLPTKINKKKFTHLAHRKQNLRPAFPKGKQEFKFKFFQPWSQALNVEVVYKCKCEKKVVGEEC